MNLEVMLVNARKKAEAALKTVSDQEAMLAHAQKRGLKALYSTTSDALKRQRLALSRAEALVVELEKEVGQLPLGKAAKQP